ncbi:MAG: DNA polymerase IV [Lachnospiraceae bacterium]|jgi:DNA polymerase-4|nr:DNA polymerase IV [Lachnospiraceae bacterium]
MERVIFHIDVNSAFLSWEAAYRIRHLGAKLDLRNIPSAVGGDKATRHGIILAKSTPAKKYHIMTGEAIADALKKCPDLVVVPPNYALYEKNSKAFIEILRNYTDVVEQYSVDEAFCDMTGTQALFGSPVIAATTIKDRIRDELGFTVNVGISSNKLLAKMASDFQKPDKVHTLFPEEISRKLWPLPVSDLFFVGRATEKKLYTLGIHTIGELADTRIEVLRAHFNKHGEVIHNFAWGRDVSLVESQAPAAKGYGNSITIAFDVCDASTAKMVLLSLCETIATRLRKHEVKAGLLSIYIRNFEFFSASHQKVLPSATNITVELHQAASELFDELWDGSPIRLLGVQASRITSGEQGRQLSLFETPDYERLERLEATSDKIRTKFGNDAVQRASFLHNKTVDHMSGGVKKDKINVDYKKQNLDIPNE